MQRNLKAFFFILVALVLEYFAFKKGVMIRQDIPMLFLFLLLHSFFSIAMAYAQTLYLPKLYQSQKKEVSFLLGLFNFIVPVFGSLFGWLMIFWGFSKSQKIEIAPTVNDIDMEVISSGFPVVERIFGEGSLHSLLKNDAAPTGKKIKALSILSQMKSRQSYALIKEALSDKDDEVRLVGFSMIDKMEKKVNEKIHSLKDIIMSQKDAKVRARYQKELAFTYWELLYQGLIDEQLRDYLIKDILLQIRASKKEISQDGQLFKLEARVLLLQEKFKEAKDAFVTAMNLGVSEGEIASYMAEISYFEKNYTRIAYWMQKIPAQSLNYQLYSLRSVWMDER
jgi:hypothetical protein